jgi:hypothetical protein
MKSYEEILTQDALLHPISRPCVFWLRASRLTAWSR